MVVATVAAEMEAAVAVTDPKQVIIVRKDLPMRKGKLGAQVAHASLEVFLSVKRIEIRDRGWGSDRPDSVIFPVSEAEQTWLRGMRKKIVVGVDTEIELLEIHTKAEQAGLVCSLIQDAGLTEFKQPEYTAVAIGPDLPEKIDIITGHLKPL